jgi:hypothetical protein
MNKTEGLKNAECIDKTVGDGGVTQDQPLPKTIECLVTPQKLRTGYGEIWRTTQGRDS